MSTPSSPLSRRRFLQATCSAAASLAAAPLLRARSPRPARARAVLQVFLKGGLAHQDSFDPKPFAASRYRTPFRVIPTALDGVQFTELFPRMAKIAGRLTVCRSLHHTEAAHERGAHSMFTGYRPSPALVYPSMGSVVAHELGPQHDLPPYVCIPDVPIEYAGGGYLGARFGPFAVGGDPGRKDFAVRDLAPPEGVDAARCARRRALQDAVDETFTGAVESDAVAAMSGFYERAYALMQSPAARAAFDLAAEPDAVRDRYGRDAAGQRLLLGRRLVEAGVRWVTVNYGAFDHHDQLAVGLRKQAPALDRAFATLITDLDQRGLQDDVLVMLVTEFGRSPLLNDSEGRDHWPRVFAAVLAGGGTRRGHVHGASDAEAAEPESDPLPVEDLAATVYHLLGIDPDRKLLAPGGRPIEIVKGGRVTAGLLA